MKKFLHQSFILFLFGYALIVGLHLLEITWNPQTTVLFFCGTALAVLAHARKNYFTIAILALHMGIEWFEWSHQTLNVQQTVFNCAHAAMDFIFLSHELKVHVKQYRKIILAGLLGILITVFFFGHSVPIETQTLKSLEPLVIGGVLGCICSHIWFHIKKE